jgi:hypothetical protein
MGTTPGAIQRSVGLEKIFAQPQGSPPARFLRRVRFRPATGPTNPGAHPWRRKRPAVLDGVGTAGNDAGAVEGRKAPRRSPTTAQRGGSPEPTGGIVCVPSIDSREVSVTPTRPPSRLWLNWSNSYAGKKARLTSRQKRRLFSVELVQQLRVIWPILSGVLVIIVGCGLVGGRGCQDKVGRAGPGVSFEKRAGRRDRSKQPQSNQEQPAIAHANSPAI